MSEPGLTAPRLQADDLACLRGGRLVFVGLSFRLGAGEALVLTGPNGSGKSSLLRLVAGLVPAFAGTLDWTGAPGSIAYLGHQDAVKPALTPRETLRFWGAASGASPDRVDIEAALAAVGLEGLDDLPCRYLSAGQRRRLALARFELETIPMKLTWYGHSAFRIEAGAAKILIDPFLSDNPSWDKGWIGSRAGEDSTQGGGR